MTETDSSTPQTTSEESAASDGLASSEAATPSDGVVCAAGMKWYVLRVASNKETQVRNALERKVTIEGLEGRVGRVLVPTVPEKKMKGGVLRVYQRKLYPGYVFVEMQCEEDGSVNEGVWFMVKETTGVGDFIGSDGKPTSMPDHEVTAILAASEKAEEEPSLSGLNIHKGDQVKVTDGAFENYEGEVEAVDERRGMVSVIVSIFGRMTPVEVGYWQLEKVE
ncbi:MAG: transcription termination/antitermination protein NusG [Phycisphaerae bacterium]